MRVLVVDDEADIRELLDLTLSRMGLAADCAGTVAGGEGVSAGRALSAVSLTCACRMARSGGRAFG